MLPVVGLQMHPLGIRVMLDAFLAVTTNHAYISSSQMCLETQESGFDGSGGVCCGWDTVGID